jgi:recombinational DNA repair protein (RecF pathway)
MVANCARCGRPAKIGQVFYSNEEGTVYWHAVYCPGDMPPREARLLAQQRIDIKKGIAERRESVLREAARLVGDEDVQKAILARLGSGPRSDA